jgi:thymidylate synthase
VVAVRQYLDLVERIIQTGVAKSDRTGTGTRSVFGHQMRFDLEDGFPLVTTKKLASEIDHHTSCCGSCAAKPMCAGLTERGVTIWDEWADAKGELGPVYGYQWRSWPGRPSSDGGTIDQIKDLISRDPEPIRTRAA